MIRKEHFFPLLAAFLGIAFVLVSFALWMSRGKNAALLRRKMKIGALLLTLTASVSCHTISTCYVPTSSVRFLSSSSGKIGVHAVMRKHKPALIRLKHEKYLKGGLMTDKGSDYSYRLVSSKGVEIKREDIDYTETGREYMAEFNINTETLRNGTYDLYFYNCASGFIHEDRYMEHYQLRIRK